MIQQQKNPITTKHRKRLVFVALGIFSLFSLLVFQFFKIQIVNGDKWSRVAEMQHFFTVREPFMRGTFWSNTSIKRGHPDKPYRFVLDIEKFHLFIDPVSIPKNHRDPIASYLIDQLEISQQEKQIFRSHFDRNSRSRKLAMWLDRETRDSILSWWQSYARRHRIVRNALYFVADYKRSYPSGKLLGQLLHTVQNNRDEQTKQALPTGGLELYFNDYLQGKQGKRLLKRSPRHSFETGKVINSPEDGADIYLTINHYLQAIAEEEIEKGVKRCHAKGGWAVMMEPRTGEILVLAQYPFFFPARYQEYFNDAEKIENTRVKAITDANEPGSVVKPLTLATALIANKELRDAGKSPLFDPEEKIPCSDGRFPGRKKEISDVHRHNYLNMWMALQKSSNIYFSRLVERIIDNLGTEWYRQVLEKTFGFGVKTDLELPAESPGVLPTPGKMYSSGALEWSTPTPFSLAIGHNLQVNSVQLLRAYSVLANGGYFVEPTLIRKIVKKDADGAENILLDNSSPERVQRFARVLDSDIVSTVVKAMKYVTKPGGSGRRADVWGYTEVGKTGTSNKIVGGKYSETQYVSCFIGFTPVEGPAFVLLVVMEEPECLYIPGVGHNHHGSISSAPVFKEIAKRSLEYLGITPDDPHGYPFGDPRYDREQADWLPENRKLQEIYEKWNN